MSIRLLSLSPVGCPWARGRRRSLLLWVLLPSPQSVKADGKINKRAQGCWEHKVLRVPGSQPQFTSIALSCRGALRVNGGKIGLIGRRKLQRETAAAKAVPQHPRNKWQTQPRGNDGHWGRNMDHKPTEGPPRTFWGTKSQRLALRHSLKQPHEAGNHNPCATGHGTSRT